MKEKKAHCLDWSHAVFTSNSVILYSIIVQADSSTNSVFVSLPKSNNNECSDWIANG